MAKQTAVQFLVMKYNQWQGVLKDRDIEEAKEIEKQQIIEADLHGSMRTVIGCDFTLSTRRVKELAEQYYNDNYENNK